MSDLDDLKALYDDTLNADNVLELPVVPMRWKGRVWIRYRVPANRAALDDVMRAVTTGTVLGKEADLDLVTECTGEVLRRVDGKFVALFDDGGPFRFDRADDRLGEWLGGSYVTEREQVQALFMTAAHPASVAGHFDQLLAWLQGLTELARERVEGN